MRVAFRVDASRAIGTGHVMRCLALADAVAEVGGDCCFVMRRLDGNLIEFVARRGHRVVALPAPPERPARASAADPYRAWLEVDPATDATESVAALAADAWDWLVVDHYALDAEWERAVGGVAARLAVIDDLADRPHHADLLIDQNLSDDPARYDHLTSPECERLLGPRYALLRPEFARRRAASHRDPRGPVRRALVFLGGVDAPGATMLALIALEAARDDDLMADVVVGATNPRGAEIADWSATRAWVRLHPGDADLAALMDAADVAIGAAGTTVWERCALGLPSVIVAIADNQMPGASAVAGRGAALFAGCARPGEDRQAQLTAMLTSLLASPELRAHLASQAARLVDGGGVSRILSRLRGAAPTLRRAEAADADAIFEWRNAESTRRHFRDPRPVPAADHRHWLETTLADTNRDLLIGEVGGDPVGVLRFDHRDDVAEVSIYVVPGQEGIGHGPRLLRAGLGWIRRERPGTRTIEAEVLTDNAASHRAFLAAGFMPLATRYCYAFESGTGT